MDYDAIIVGARVAGSSLAILLGRQRRRVLLVDRDRFPSDTLSTHLLKPPAVELLGRLGALAEVEASGLRRLARMRTYLGDSVLEGALHASGGYALCARRDHLDVVLIRHALRHPSVEFLDRTTVEDLLWEDGRVNGVHLRGSNGRRTLHARVVVGVFHQDGHIGFVLPMQPGLDCLALAVQPEEFPSFRADPAGRFEEAFLRLSGMRTRLAGARREGKVQGTRGVENFFRVPYGPGWVLTGDAAYCKDPNTGTGIEDAFRGAFLLAEPLGATLDGADWERTMSAFPQTRDETFLAAYRGTLAYTRGGDVPAESLAWLQAVSASAGLVRQLGTAFPAALRAPGVLPAGLLPSIERSAGRFAAASHSGSAERQAA
jgi:2-polyprenyl-6-methoxyphenol hydroxylase-like FAD-dependent oxidoreductase